MLRARCRSICAMALRTMCIGSRVSRQCSVTIRPSTRWILRRQENRTPSGLFRPDPTHELVLAAVQRTRERTARPKLVQVSQKLQTWSALGSIWYFGSLYGTREISNGRQTCWVGISARPRAEGFCFQKCGDGVVARLRGVVVKDQSRPDSGLVQNCSAFFHGRFSSDQAERLRGNCRLQI